MKTIHFFLFVSLLSTIISCEVKNKRQLAIRDFSKNLQPHLMQVVSKGIVGWDSSIHFIEQHATDEELTELSRSEHPVLRAVAFRAMLERPTFDHFEIIMDNLSDTAIVAIDQGEFGINFYKIADDIICQGKWNYLRVEEKNYR